MIIALLTRFARNLDLAYRRRKARHELRALSDHYLRDIGIERHQIAALVDARIADAAANPTETQQLLLGQRLGEPRAVQAVTRVPAAV